MRYCSTQNNVPHPKDAHVLSPGTYEYVRLCVKGEIRLQLELRFADQLTLRLGEEPGLLR